MAFPGMLLSGGGRLLELSLAEATSATPAATQLALTVLAHGAGVREGGRALWQLSVLCRPAASGAALPGRWWWFRSCFQQSPARLLPGAAVLGSLASKSAMPNAPRSPGTSCKLTLCDLLSPPSLPCLQRGTWSSSRWQRRQRSAPRSHSRLQRPWPRLEQPPAGPAAVGSAASEPRASQTGTAAAAPARWRPP